MKKLVKARKFVKSNVTSLVFFMILLVMVLIVMLVASVLVPTAKTSQYGDRLDDISKVKISDSEQSTIEEELKDNDIVSKANVRISGKIINVEIELNSKGTIDTGKALATSIVNKFTSDEVNYYDFQLFVTSSGSDGYTVIGYKTPDTDSFTWSNN